MTYLTCGCVAIATCNGRPCCVLHGNDEPTTPPKLTDRKASCSICGKIKTSSLELPFFRHNKGEMTDSYYCGCSGWD